MVALQWMVSNHEAFTHKFIDTNVLERLIRQNARRVDVSSLMVMSNDQVNLPKLAKLYTKDELSDRFILILEGRVQVTIGQVENSNGNVPGSLEWNGLRGRPLALFRNRDSRKTHNGISYLKQKYFNNR